MFLTKKNSKKLKKYTFPFLLSLIVPFLISGPFLPDLLLTLSSILFLFYVLKKNDLKYFKSNPLIIFFVFCIYCVFCSLLSEQILFSLKSSFFYFRIGIFTCLIWYMIEKNISILTFFYYTLVGSFLLLTFDSYFQYFFEKNFFGYSTTLISGRVPSMFGNELILGSYLSRLFPLLFALFVIKSKKSHLEVTFIGILFILVDVLIFLSGERSAFFFLNLSTLFIIILIKKYQKFRLFTFVIGLIFCFILTFSNSNVKNRMITSPLSNMGIIESSSKKYIFTPSHDSLIRTGFSMFADKPILGHGPKMFRIKCSNKKYSTGIEPCSTHPHNFYIQLLAETGIIGFSFLLSVFCYVLFCAYKQIKTIIYKKKRYLSDYQICLLSGILISVWPFSPNGNFFNNWLIITYSLPLGFYIQSFYMKKKKPKTTIFNFLNKIKFN